MTGQGTTTSPIASAIPVQDTPITSGIEKLKVTDNSLDGSKKERHAHAPSLGDPASRIDTASTDATPGRHHKLLHPHSWFTPSTPPSLWQQTELALKTDDVAHAQKLLRKLTKHTDYALRAHTLLMVIGVVQEWSHKSISSSTTKLLVSAADAGSKDAAALLLYLIFAKRCRVSFKDSDLLYEVRKAAEDGFTSAQAVYGLYLARAVPFDDVVGDAEPLRARTLLSAAARKGHFLALDRLEWHVMNERSGGEIGEDGVSSAEFVGMLKEAAKAGHGDCAVRMAKLVRKGVGCAQSEEEASEWTRKAAALNVPPAVSAAHAEIVRENLLKVRKGEGGNEDVRKLEAQMAGWRGDGGWSCAVFTVFALEGGWVPGGGGIWRYWEEREKHKMGL